MSEMYGGKRPGSRKGSKKASKKASRKQKGGFRITNPALIGKPPAGEPVTTYNPKLNNNRPLDDWCVEKTSQWGDECWMGSKAVWIKYDNDGNRNSGLLLGDVCPKHCGSLRGENRLSNIMPAGTVKKRSAELSGKINLKPVGAPVAPMRNLVTYSKANMGRKYSPVVPAQAGGKRRKASKKGSKNVSKKVSKKNMKGGKKGSRKASKKGSKKGSKKSSKKARKVSRK